jgi:hypothetical protein
MVRSCEHLVQPQATGLLLIGCPRLIIQYILSNPQYWRLYLQPQPEDAPCRGDRDPLITERYKYSYINLYPGARWRWGEAGELHAPAALSPGKNHGTQYMGGWVGPRILSLVCGAYKKQFIKRLF